MPGTREIELRPPRRIKLPVLLFVATALSTFWAGASHWVPQEPFSDSLGTSSWMPVRQVLVAHWNDGLVYMAALLGILLTHEMGHFLATIAHRIRASLPYFIPFPVFSPIGTMGAVIAMDAMRANRKELFDIGIAGPLAGLAVALPVCWLGTQQLDLTTTPRGPYSVDLPILMRWMLDVVQPPGYERGSMIPVSQLNPLFMAGWVGLLVTGLNMLPVSQLDGGHVTYTLIGRKAHWLAWCLVIGAVIYMVMTSQYTWVLMLALVVFVIGVRHPPTSDDQVPLGPTRYVIGCASLVIPFLCFAPKLLEFRL